MDLHGLVMAIIIFMDIAALQGMADPISDSDILVQGKNNIHLFSLIGSSVARFCQIC